MQLILIVGIIFAIGAVLFALQNIAPVTVTLAAWSFDGSLALVLLMALGAGALIAGLLSTPTVVRSQWKVKRLKRQIAEFERKFSELERKLDASEKDNVDLKAELRAEVAKRPAPAANSPSDQAVAEKPYVGLRALIAGRDDGKAT